MLKDLNSGSHYKLQVERVSDLKIANRFAALENLNDREVISRVWENIQENIKISATKSLGL
jgi:septal ring-binding cell division protein DamX